jgi:hypothetical protein
MRDPVSGRPKDIVRYDDAGGYPYRHSTGFYEAEALRYDYEVADNEEEHRDAVD